MKIITSENSNMSIQMYNRLVEIQVKISTIEQKGVHGLTSELQFIIFFEDDRLTGDGFNTQEQRSTKSYD